MAAAKASPVSNIRKLRSLLRQMGIPPVYLLGPVALSFCTAAFEGASIGLLIPILTGFLQKNFSFILETAYIGSAVRMLPESVFANDRVLFGVLLGSFVTAVICKNALRYFTVLSIAYYSERCLHRLRKTLFGRYLGFGKLFFDTTNIGHHSTLLAEFAPLALRPISVVDKIINSLFSLTVYLIVMFTISWRLTLIALPLFIVLYMTVKSMIFTIKKLSYRVAERGSALGKKSIEILSTMPLVKSYRTEILEERNYATISDEKARLDFKSRALQEMILPLQEIITLVAATAIFIGSLFVFGRDQIASAPALVVYFYVVLNASSKFGTLSGFRSTLAVVSGPLDAVLTIFDEHDKFAVRGGNVKFDGVRNHIEARNLSFSYSSDRQVLANVSFTVEKGQMTAIVGPTGSGKSTLINLLMRYYDCPPGSIFIDDRDIRDFDLDSYLSHVALVSQETLLLHDSLRNNITYGLKNVPEEAVKDVVRRSRLAEFVGELPQGLDTLIGDRGVKLSGGEKQRVSIARALLKNASILILDEATSSLDSRTEKLIQEAIDEAVADRTSIVIAHRLSTIRHAQKIVVLENGQMKEQGTLEKLLESKGLFFRLWEEQRF